MEKDIKNFLKQDEIDMFKFFANSEIFKNETKEIYQATAKLHSEIDVSDDATKSIYWVALPCNQPLGYPKWFLIAYPDVIKWFSKLVEERTDENIMPIIGEVSEQDFISDGKINISFLRRIVDAYKVDYFLECSQ